MRARLSAASASPISAIVAGSGMSRMVLASQVAQARAVGDAEYVRVDRDGFLAEGDVEHHIGTLAADTRQRLQRFAAARNFSAMLRHQQF